MSQRQTLVIFTLGTALGGVVSALALLILSGLLSIIPLPIRMLVLSAITVLALLTDFRLVRIRWPENRRLVPIDVLKNHPFATALQFGFELGTGVRTYVPSACLYVLAAALATLSPSVGLAVCVGIAFGIGRAAMLWLRLAMSDQEAFDLELQAGEASLIRWSSILATVCVVAMLGEEVLK